MAISFNNYPYTDFHEANLDWMLGKVKELDQKINDDLETYIREILGDLFISALYDPATETLILTLEET